MVLEKINDRICQKRNICDLAGKSKNYLISGALAVLLDFILPFAHLLVSVVLNGWFALGANVLLIGIAIISWFFLAREIGIYALIPIIIDIIAIIMMVTIIFILIGIVLLFIPSYIVAIILHWWDYRNR
jgi:hypothetical protein